MKVLALYVRPLLCWWEHKRAFVQDKKKRRNPGIKEMFNYHAYFLLVFPSLPPFSLSLLLFSLPFSIINLHNDTWFLTLKFERMSSYISYRQNTLLIDLIILSFFFCSQLIATLIDVASYSCSEQKSLTPTFKHHQIILAFPWLKSGSYGLLSVISSKLYVRV